jgi:hypothetical protein
LPLLFFGCVVCAKRFCPFHFSAGRKSSISANFFGFVCSFVVRACAALDLVGVLDARD